MQEDWRGLPPAPPLAAFLCSTTSAAVTQSILPSSLLDEGDVGSGGEKRKHFHRLLRVRCSVIAIKYAGVYPVSCNVCRGRVPNGPPGSRCTKNGCGGMATLQPNWQVLCVVDDGTGEAALYLEGAVAETLLQLPPKLKHDCLTEANRTGGEIDFSKAVWMQQNRNNNSKGGRGGGGSAGASSSGSDSAFFTESFKRDVSAVFDRVKHRRFLVCCVVIGSRAQIPTKAATTPVAAKTSSSGRGLDDGWRCAECQNQNFPSRKVCRRCGADPTSAKYGNKEPAGVQLQSSSIQGPSGTKYVTAALPRLELKGFHVADVDPRTEAYLLLRRLSGRGAAGGKKNENPSSPFPGLGLAPPPPAAAAAGGLAAPTDQKSGSGTTAEEKELMEMAMEEE
jgi:hypothetical protein